MDFHAILRDSPAHVDPQKRQRRTKNPEHVAPPGRGMEKNPEHIDPLFVDLTPGFGSLVVIKPLK